MRSLNVGMPTAYFYDDGIDGAITSELIEALRKVRVIAIDTETTGLNKTRDVPLFWSLSWRSVDGQVHRCTLHAGLLHRFHKLFYDERISWVFANAKFDMHMLANAGIRFAGQVVDIQVMHALLYEEHPHRLKYVSDHILGWTWKDFMDTFKVQKDGRLTRTSTVEEVEAGGRFLSVQDALLWAYENDRDLLTEYASNDAYGTLLLFEKLEELLMKVEVDCGMDAMMREMDPNHRTIIGTLADLFFIVEVPFTKVLWKCERNGVVIDVEFLEGLKAPMEERLAELTRQIAHEADKAGALLTNPNSTKQLREYFFDVMKYTPLKRTKGGKGGVRAPSTDEATITYLSDKYNDPVANLLLAVRDITKTKGTYVEGLLDRLDEDGRIRTKFNQDVARTGRLSSSDPNLQNIKNPEDDIYQIRKAFIVPPGYVMIVFDYKQLEMRLLAALSGEQDMIDIFKKGWDIHIGNASLVFDFPYDDIKRAKKMSEDEWDALKVQDPAQHKYLQDCLHARSAAKTIGFGQPTSQAEVKLPQNGEPYRLRPMATPCCAARHSLSTCARLRWASTRRRRPDGWLVTPHASLTRGAQRRNRCESSKTSRANGAENFSPRLVQTANGASHAEGNITSSPAKTDGTGRTRRRGTIKLTRTTTPGRVGVLRTTTKRSRTTTTARSVSGAVQKRCSFITRTKTTRTPPSKTWNLFANVVTRFTTIARRIFPTRRHSQYQGKLWIDTLNYGMKKWELAKRLKCTVAEAEEKMEAYMDRYPAVRRFFEDSVDIVRETTCAHTFLGRRRVLPDIHAHDEQMRWRAERQSGNVRIQGTAADVAKMAMILCDEANLEEKYGCRMLLQVHDEIVFECPAETADAAMEEIRNLMEHPFLIDLPVELLTDAGKGAHWAEAK